MDLLICQTQEMKDQFIEHFPKIEKRTKVKVIPNPIDLNGKAELANMPLEPTFQTDCLVSAGRLIELKGYNYLISAFEILKKDYPELKLVILGRGPLMEVVKAQVDNSVFSEDIYMQGRVNNVYNYFKNARICVVSSIIEGFPNVLLQMMSQNEKVVSTLCAGGIEDIEGLITCEPGNSEALYQALKSCLKANTNNNRKLFDDYLNSRSLTEFVRTVNENLY